MSYPGEKAPSTQYVSSYLLEKLSVLMKTGIFRLEGETIICYPRNDPSNPLLRCEALRERLLAGSRQQEAPFLWEDTHHVFFAGIRFGGKPAVNRIDGMNGAQHEMINETPSACISEDLPKSETADADETVSAMCVGRAFESEEKGADDQAVYYLLGPMSTEGLDLLHRHKFYLSYGIMRTEEKELPHFTLYEVVNAVCAAAKVVCGAEFTEMEVLQANRLSYEPEESRREQVLYSMEEDEREFYRHTYQDERELLDKVREGEADEAVRLSGIMDAQIGRLAAVELDHWRNLLIVSVTLCARAAIEGGLEPHKAYRISGFYIRKGTGCRDSARVVEIRNNAIRELADSVHEVRSRRHVSGYTRQCRDYIEQHYREKISQEEVASHLGISADYLSRLFREEVGMSFPDCVNQFRVERAANLLIYSEESLSDIARYVNFPSQSYFGRMFKKYKGMTPGQYREMYKPSEFISGKSRT